MGAGISLGEFSQGAKGVYLGYLTNKTPTGGVTAGTTISTDTSGDWYASGDLEYGLANYGDNKYGTHWGISGNINRGIDTNSRAFFDVGAGVNVTYNQSYTQNRNYALGSMPTTYVKSTTKEGMPNLGLRYQTAVVPTGNKTDKQHSVDVSVSASAAAGLIGDNDSRTYVFGNLSQELTRHKNTTAQVGLGYATEGSFLGNDVIYNVKAGYQHNFNGNTSADPTKHSGGFISAGMQIPF